MQTLGLSEGRRGVWGCRSARRQVGANLGDEADDLSAEPSRPVPGRDVQEWVVGTVRSLGWEPGFGNC